jgi:hypothetical protein
MRSWFFGAAATPTSSRRRKRDRVGLSIDSSDSSDGGDEAEMPQITGMAAAPATWALDWAMTDSSDDDSIGRKRSMSEPYVYGDDSSSLGEEPDGRQVALARGGSHALPSPFLLPAPRRILYPEVAVYQHTNTNNNHSRGTRRRTRTTEEHDRHNFWRSTALDSDDDDQDMSNSSSSLTRKRRSRKFWTPYRLLMVLFLFATYTTFWLPIPTAPQATYSLRGSRISLDHATSTTSTTTLTSTTTATANQNPIHPLPQLDNTHARGGRMTAAAAAAGKSRSIKNINMALARPSETTSLEYRNVKNLERFYQQEAFHHETDDFFRWSWYCNVMVLSMFVAAAAREYKNRGQAACSDM